MPHNNQRHRKQAAGFKRQNAFHPTASFSDDPGSPISTPIPQSSSQPQETSASPTSQAPPPSSPPPASDSQTSSPSSSPDPSSAASQTTPTDTTTTSTTTTTSDTPAPTSNPPTSAAPPPSQPLDIPQTITVPSTTTPTLTTPTFTRPSVTPSVIDGNSPSNNASGASKTSTGTVVGIVVGVIAGVGALIIIAGFIRRRLRKPRDRYNRDSFIRQSMVLPDDGPNTIIGTRNALALARANMGQQDTSPVTPPTPPHMTEHNYGAAAYYQDNAAYTPHAYTMSPGYDPTQLTRRPSTGKPGDGRGPYPASPMDQYPYENASHIHDPQQQRYDQMEQSSRANVVSVTPFQQQQYAEIGRQLNYPPIAHMANNSADGHTYHDAAHSPFSDPDPAAAHSPTGSVNDNPALSRALSTTYGSLSATQPTANEPTRSGTPVDANPQQAYHPPSPVGPGGVSYPDLNSARNVQVEHHDADRHQAHMPAFVDGAAPQQQHLNTPYGGPVQANVSRETVYDADDAYGGI